MKRRRKILYLICFSGMLLVFLFFLRITLPDKRARILVETTGNREMSLAVSSNGVAYILNLDGKLVAVEGASGKRIWQFDYHSEFASDPTIGPKDTLCFVTWNWGGPEGERLPSGKLYALDSTTGKKRWTFLPGRGLWKPVLGQNGLVYVSVEHVFALDVKTGRKRWTFKLNQQRDPADVRYATVDALTCSPNLVFFTSGFPDRYLYALDSRTGKLKWREALSTTRLGSANADINLAVNIHNKLVVQDPDGNVCEYEAETGRLLWSHPGDAIISYPALSATGEVYIGDWKGNVYQLYGKARQEIWRRQIWRTKLSDRVETPTLDAARNRLYVGTTNGEVVALDTDTGAVQTRISLGTDWQYYTRTLHPAATPSPLLASDGKLYVSYARKIWVIDPNS